MSEFSKGFFIGLGVFVALFVVSLVFGVFRH